MTATTPPPFLSNIQAPASGDRLVTLRAAVAEVRDAMAEKADLEARLEELNKTINGKLFKDLPDLMDAAGVSSISLPAEGNQPAVTAKAQPFYRANIAASWPEDRRQKAFAVLEAAGAGDLIKTEVDIAFPREAREAAKAFASEVASHGLQPTMKEAVSHQTLTAWLKEQVEAGQIPDLEALGATIGRQVKIKEE